jgi:hypothetical protein
MKLFQSILKAILEYEKTSATPAKCDGS